jgi:hypothetical protein
MYGPGKVVHRESPAIHGPPSNSRAVNYVTKYHYEFLRAVPTNPTPGVWYS